tara:strand:- start:1206 stop:1892 length:687 start_codon:yes stop_codon:yes gene_type:complete
MRPTGVFVGIPLTILQESCYHMQTGNFFNPTSFIFLNACIGHCVYDADRIKDVNDDIMKKRYDVSISTALLYTSNNFYECDLKIMVPFLVVLNKWYSDLKPLLGVSKPFFVAFFWTVAIYIIPLQHVAYNVGYIDFNVMTPISVFLQMASWSNIADIKDIEDDKKKLVFTPSTKLGKRKSSAFSFVVLLISVFMHNFCYYYDYIDKSYDLVNLVSMITICIMFVDSPN